MMKHPERVLTLVVVSWLGYLAVAMGSWIQWSNSSWQYRQWFDGSPHFTHDVNQQKGNDMQLHNILKNLGLALTLAIASLIGQVEAQSASTPIISPMKLGIDYRRNPTPNLEQPGTWVDQYVVSGSTVVSATISTTIVSGTSFVGYRISPAIDVYSGALCNYLVRNNANAEPSNTTSNVTNGTAWEQNRTSGWLFPGATDSTSRWVAIYMLGSNAARCRVTVTWETMITQ